MRIVGSLTRPILPFVRLCFSVVSQHQTQSGTNSWRRKKKKSLCVVLMKHNCRQKSLRVVPVTCGAFLAWNRDLHTPSQTPNGKCSISWWKLWRVAWWSWRPRKRSWTRKEWIIWMNSCEAIKLGRFVKDKKINSLEIYVYSLPVKKVEIIEYFMAFSLKEEVLIIIPVQKQTYAGQRTRFKAIVAIADCNCHVGLGVKCSKEVATKTQVILP